jgi:hypothetical protein
MPQQNAIAPTPSGSGTVPNSINYASVLKDANGKPATNKDNVTFLLYGDQEGGSPLWLETQNVTPDQSGRYTVQLGATSPNGLPVDLFISEQARWLAVQVSGQPEQARVMMVAVPYAIKAKDAETIGGLPPSAFVQATQVSAVAASSDSALIGNPSVSRNIGAGHQLQGTPNWVLLDDGTGQSMRIFANAAPVGVAPGTVQFIPNTGDLIGIEGYSIGLMSGTYGDFYCHHGMVGGGGGVCYFADVANNSGHVANSFSQSMQFDSVNPYGTDLFTNIRANAQNSLEVSSGITPGTSFGTIRQVPTVFANLPACGSAVEGTTATVTDSTANTFGATIAGGGRNHVLAYCDGTYWTVAAK